MDMTGEYRIPAPRQRVWEGLNDPEVLKSAIPGCQTIEKVSDTEFTAKVLASVGPVRATFGGKLAQIGSRLIDSVSRKMAEQFFERFVAAVAPEQPATATAETGEAEAAPVLPITPVEAHPEAAQPETETQKTRDIRLPPVIWATGLAAVIGGILYYFTGRRVMR